DWIRKRLPVKASRSPTTSSAALPSRWAFVAVQVPCSFFWASSPGSAKARTSSLARIRQHIVEVSRRMVLLPLWARLLGVAKQQIEHPTTPRMLASASTMAKDKHVTATGLLQGIRERRHASKSSLVVDRLREIDDLGGHPRGRSSDAMAWIPEDIAQQFRL